MDAGKGKKVLGILTFTVVTAALMGLIGVYGLTVAQAYRSKLDDFYRRVWDAREEILHELDQAITEFTTPDSERPRQ